MRLIVAVLVACGVTAAQGLPAGVDQLANIDAIIGFPDELEATTFAVDPHGAVYIAGTLESVPAGTTAVFTEGQLNQNNVLVVKMDAALEHVLYKVVIGGSDREILSAMSVAETGEVYLCGVTDSRDFPSTANFEQPPISPNDQRAFVLQLNAAGDRIVYSALLDGGVSPRAIAVDVDGAALIAGHASRLLTAEIP